MRLRRRRLPGLCCRRLSTEPSPLSSKVPFVRTDDSSPWCRTRTTRPSRSDGYPPRRAPRSRRLRRAEADGQHVAVKVALSIGDGEWRPSTWFRRRRHRSSVVTGVDLTERRSAPCIQMAHVASRRHPGAWAARMPAVWPPVPAPSFREQSPVPSVGRRSRRWQLLQVS